MWENKQGNPEQHWKHIFLLRTTLIVHVFSSYYYASSYCYCFCLWKTSFLNTDTVYGKYVGHNVIISHGRRVCDTWRRSNISYINAIVYVRFACLTQVTQLLHNAMLQM